MAMNQDEHGDRTGANAAPASPKPKVDKRSLRTAGATKPDATSMWIRPLADYDRHEPREAQVTRFG
jgi:hypothetical protein